MKFSIGLISLMGLISLVGSPAQAQTTTAGAQQLRDAVQKKVTEELSAIKQNVAKKAFVGTVTTKSDMALTITNLKNEPRTANLTADATILKSGNEVTAKSVKVDDFVIAMGDVDSLNVMTVKRMLIITKPTPDKRQVLLATVTKVTASALTVSAAQDETWTIKINSQTQKAKELKVDNKVIIIGTPDKAENTLVGKIIRQVL